MAVNLLGLNHGEINSSAALIQDGRLIAGCPEERFNRQKRSKAFPTKSIEFCLEAGNISLSDCNAIAQAWNPGAAWTKFNPTISSGRAGRDQYFYAIPDNLFNICGRQPSDWVKMELAPESGLPPIYYVQHHRSHAANGFFLSPFEEAAILTCDWRGEFECTTFSHGRGINIEVLQTQNVPNSLGMFYATFTEFLGYMPDSDEWKVMALSAFDLDCTEFERRIRETIRLNEDGTFELDQAFYKGAILDQPKTYTNKFVEMFDGREGIPGEEAQEWHCTIAKAMQNVAEDVAVHFLTHLHGQTRCKNVALSGGFFMNSVFNGRVLDKTPFDELYVSFAPADVGNSIGAALYVSHQILGIERQIEFTSSSIGPQFNNTEIESALNRRKIGFKYFKNIENELARLIAKGSIIGILNGSMEFGERALGNRSILADPRNPETKNKINSAIKYREAYRPFAPAVLIDRVSDVFDVAEGFECPFMEKVVPIRADWRERLGAVCHVDGSGRVQTVDTYYNPYFHKIISSFDKLTGVPVLLNTSFNINGEPIVLSPDDAISTFFNSGLDYLALENYLISKSDC
ncbi:hypothetical protein HQ496_07195 [bacterium]|nr:hypothetical protein [bacterium]